MQVFNTSFMIYAWDNYPIRQFPGLWDWMKIRIMNKELVMPSVAFDEVAGKTPDCAEWLKGNELELIEISNTIIQDAMRIESLLGIADDKYGAGVGENDLFIIAAARACDAQLVTNEERQTILPKKLAKYKIPAVCSMKEVSVDCINFIDYIKNSNMIFR
jgi:hypothetical protein